MSLLAEQLYLNALFKREGARFLDLGGAFNYVGSELKRAVLLLGGSHTSRSSGGSGAGGVGGNLSSARRMALRDACILHLTRKVPKLYTADWVARRALSSAADVLQCGPNATRENLGAAGAGERRRALRKRLPPALPAGKYSIGRVLCEGEPPPCAPQPWLLGSRLRGGR